MMNHTASAFLRLVAIVCLCLGVGTQDIQAKKNRRGRRGRRQNPAQRARQQNIKALRHTAKHTGTVVRLGEKPKGMQILGKNHAEIRRIHARNQQRSDATVGSEALMAQKLGEVLALKRMREAEQAAAAKEEGAIVVFDRGKQAGSGSMRVQE